MALPLHEMLGKPVGLVVREVVALAQTNASGFHTRVGLDEMKNVFDEAANVVAPIEESQHLHGQLAALLQQSPLGDIADVALKHLGGIHRIDVADELHIDTPAVLGF